MNKKLEAVLIGLGVFAAAYLTGCFVEANFNIAQWSPLTRIMIGVLGMFISAMITSFYYNEIKHEK
jgi:hypothetical protein